MKQSLNGDDDYDGSKSTTQRNIICVLSLIICGLIASTVYLYVETRNTTATAVPTQTTNFVPDWPLASQMCKKKVLVILSSEYILPLHSMTNASQMFNYITGFFLDELATPILALIDAGFDYDIATNGGIAAKADDRSNASKYFATEEEWLRAQAFITNPKMVNPVDLRHIGGAQSILDGSLDSYDVIFIPGGHAPLIDLFRDPNLGRILLDFHAKQKMITAICHGPSAFASVVFGVGQTPWPFKGYKMVVFETEADKRVERLYNGTIPFYPQVLIESLGAAVQNFKVPVGSAQAVWDGNVVTGQNPMSATVLVDLIESRYEVMCDATHSDSD